MRSDTPEVRIAEAKDALPDDAALMGRVAAGDRTAYAQLVLRHADRFLALAERLLGERGEAEDAVQEAFAKLWARADSFDAARARFTTWFYRVVANACHDRQRRRRRVEPLPAAWDAADPAAGADARVAAGQQARVVEAALAALPERQRTAIVLSYYEELSNEEAAAAMGVSVKALESLLVRARRALRISLVEEAERQ